MIETYDKTITFTDKTNNMYRLSRKPYDMLLTLIRLGLSGVRFEGAKDGASIMQFQKMNLLVPRPH